MFSVSKLTTRTLPRSVAHYARIKNAVLGTTYELSLVFTTPQQSRHLNHTRRGKNKIANVLSFPLDKNCGEIFIHLGVRKEAKKFHLTYAQYIDFLLIHGALHLRGYDHGPTMERLEQKFLANLSK